MRRRSRAGGEPAKSQRGKSAALKRRNAPKTVRDRGVSVTSQEPEVARLTRERNEALERETATSQVLRLISKSPGNLELVFRSILENATRICEAKFGILTLREGHAFRVVAIHNAPPAYVEFRTREPIIRPTTSTALVRAMATKKPVQFADIQAARHADPRFFHRSRFHPPRWSDGTRHVPCRGQEARGVALSLGLLQDPPNHSG